MVIREKETGAEGGTATQRRGYQKKGAGGQTWRQSGKQSE